MSDELKLEHKTLDEAINYHSTWFEYHLNMGHLSVAHLADEQAKRHFGEAANHATILAELRHHAEVANMKIRIKAMKWAKDQFK